MGTSEDIDILDNKKVGACLARINNHIIKMRLSVKRGKAWALKDLYRKLRKIKTEKTRKAERKTLKERKLVKMEEEMNLIKSLDCDIIALYALEHVQSEDLVKLMGSDPPIERRAKARVAHTKNVKGKVEAFAKSFPDYSRLVRGDEKAFLLVFNLLHCCKLICRRARRRLLQI